MEEKATDAQMEYIECIESWVNFEFLGETKSEARKFISKYSDQARVQQDNYDMEAECNSYSRDI